MKTEQRGQITKSLEEWLRSSLLTGSLFGRHDEPLDTYGKRIIRVILTEIEQGATQPCSCSEPDVDREYCRACGRWVESAPDDGTVDPFMLIEQQWALDNIYTIARRRMKALNLEKNRQDIDALLISERGMWAHVQRLCEKAGCEPRGVLRDDGGSV